MYLLYLDDSGSVQNPNEEHLVLGGICVFEHQVQYFTQQLDSIAHRLAPNAPDSVEFHASAIFSGRQPPWKDLAKQERIGVIKEVLQVVAKSYESACVFACAVHKASYPQSDPMEIAFEDLCSRFDKRLWRLRNEGENQRGLIVLDKSAHETALQKLAYDFRTLGTKWNVIRNIVDVPLFVDSRKSRCVQVADHIAYSVFRRYEAGDTSYLDIIHSRFDSDGRVLHGLSHKQSKDPLCMCSACLSRRSAIGL
ncbi:MAG: DUF3800 domain-containing protein [Blastocatellia bacterium]